MMNDLTAFDAIKILSDRAQYCRENGDSDMRNILNTAHFLKRMISEGKSRDEILKEFSEEA